MAQGGSPESGNEVCVAKVPGMMGNANKTNLNRPDAGGATWGGYPVKYL